MLLFVLIYFVVFLVNGQKVFHELAFTLAVIKMVVCGTTAWKEPRKKDKREERRKGKESRLKG